MNVIPLSEVDAGMVPLVGGKAAALGEMKRAGERVPDGFCLTTEVYRSGQVPEGELLNAYHQLAGPGTPVAVRSSATAEDLPEASFAGQQETVLGVNGPEELLDAVQVCWASLNSDRARSYQKANNIDESEMAVVVQRMVPAQTAGVLFTADPLTGRRTTMAVDAAPGLGTGVVDGSVRADHYVLDAQHSPAEGGCLDTTDLAELYAAGERLQEHFDAPQDIEWAFDSDGVLWLLQSRPITTLFPLPPAIEGTQPRVLLEGGHMQGMLRPFTPMGMSVLKTATGDWMRAFGLREDTFGLSDLLVDVAGRLYLDISGMVRSRRMRGRLPEAMQVYGPRVASAVGELLNDPRFAARSGKRIPARTVLRAAAHALPGTVGGTFRALAWPQRTRERMFALKDRSRERVRGLEQPTGTKERIAFASGLQDATLMEELMRMLPPLWAAYMARALAGTLLGRHASGSEVDVALRGVPHNVTTEMDLELWQLAEGARTTHATLLLDTPPEILAARYRRGELPELGLGEFLDRYGHRGAAEIDVGVPRWSEDPTPIFASLANYLRSTDPAQAPDVRFRRAAKEAVATIEEVTTLARRRRPVRAGLARFLLYRARELSGLRELPKFMWLYPLEEIRRQLLAVGDDLAGLGVLERAEDIVFLDLAGAREAAAGRDMHEVVAERRRVYERELHRRRVPGLLLSDGTDLEAVLPAQPAQEGTLSGVMGAPGAATGRARVVRDPTTARIEPGEILVAPTTDPGWTPLFLTAAALVTETGSPMAHGPTVAREYGIPAVICVPDATQTISDGQLITVDGSAGTVRLEPDD